MGQQCYDCAVGKHRGKSLALAEDGQRSCRSIGKETCSCRNKNGPDGGRAVHVTVTLHKSRVTAGAAVVALSFLIGCTTPEPKPEGVGRGVSFSVTPLYPHSFEITAAGSRMRDAQELKDAWQKKAAMVAKGRRFKITSSPTVHNNESDYTGGLYGVPMLGR